MKKISLIIIILAGCINSALSQSCLPEGITFTTQVQINSFQINYPGCVEIEGPVTISGDDITNLSGLSVLTSFGGELAIGGNNVLPNLTGLNNVISVGGGLWIQSNASLSSLTGLDNLTSSGLLCLMNNDALISLTGLDNLTSIGGELLISGNNALSNLTGLDNVISVGGSLRVQSNASLSSLTGLEALTSTGGNLLIESNSALISLTGLDNISSIGGGIGITSNQSLGNLTGLNNVISIGISIAIGENTSLTSLFGLDNIAASSISGLFIYNNSSLVSCHAQSICGYLAAPSGVIDIHDNATGCNNRFEVEDSCPGFYIDELNNGTYMELYPNPANHELNISAEGYSIDAVIIYTLTGQQVLHEKQVSGTIDISHLTPGMYIVEVTVENTRLRQKLLVK